MKNRLKSSEGRYVANNLRCSSFVTVPFIILAFWFHRALVYFFNSHFLCLRILTWWVRAHSHCAFFFPIATAISLIATYRLHRTQWQFSPYVTATTSPSPIEPIMSKNKLQSQITQCERALRLAFWSIQCNYQFSLLLLNLNLFDFKTLILLQDHLKTTIIKKKTWAKNPPPSVHNSINSWPQVPGDILCKVHMRNNS